MDITSPIKGDKLRKNGKHLQMQGYKECRGKGLENKRVQKMLRFAKQDSDISSSGSAICKKNQRSRIACFHQNKSTYPSEKKRTQTKITNAKELKVGHMINMCNITGLEASSCLSH